MNRFFAIWRAVSDWLFSGLVVGCGLMCFVGAAQTQAAGGPAWMIAAMIATGILLCGGILIYIRRKR